MLYQRSETTTELDYLSNLIARFLPTALGGRNTRFSSLLCVQKELVRWVFLNRSLNNLP
jgi:hypothetical protein